MIIKTSRFGEILVEEENVITFDSGLLAFEDLTRYVLFDINEDPNFKWLQSIDNPQVCFLLVDPFTIKEDYYVYLRDEQVEKLGILAPEDVIVYTTVTVPKSGFKDATTNMIGPLIINWRIKKAKQIICETDNNIIKYPLLANDYRKLSYGG
jgi:flagellar assembly factor FliW